MNTINIIMNTTIGFPKFNNNKLMKDITIAKGITIQQA